MVTGEFAARDAARLGPHRFVRSIATTASSVQQSRSTRPQSTSRPTMCPARPFSSVGRIATVATVLRFHAKRWLRGSNADKLESLGEVRTAFSAIEYLRRFNGNK